MLFAVVDCRLWTPPAPDRPLRSARVSAPGPHKRRPGVGCRTVGRAPPTKVGRRTPIRCPFLRATSPPAPAWGLVSLPPLPPPPHPPVLCASSPAHTPPA